MQAKAVDEVGPAKLDRCRADVRCKYQNLHGFGKSESAVDNCAIALMSVVDPNETSVVTNGTQVWLL